MENESHINFDREYLLKIFHVYLSSFSSRSELKDKLANNGRIVYAGNQAGDIVVGHDNHESLEFELKLSAYAPFIGKVYKKLGKVMWEDNFAKFLESNFKVTSGVLAHEMEGEIRDRIAKLIGIKYES